MKKSLLHIQGGLSKLYNDKGRSVTFANLFDELAEKFPIDKMRRLQDLIESKRHCFLCLCEQQRAYET